MMKVRKSINIKYDSKNKTLINEYYATSSHSEIIRHVFSGILDGNTRAHIAYGPYGAGKSFISTILTGFTSQQYHTNDIKEFINKFKKVDTESATFFKSIQEHNVQYIPVLMNGFEGKFDKALIRNLKDQLLQSGYEIDDRKIAISKIVKNWELNFEYAYEKFKQFLMLSELTLETFYARINEDELFKKFEVFYERITSGAKLNVYQESDVITAFEKTSKILAKHNKGLILVYDEFGRMLQNILPEEINQFMQQLQDLAELVNNSCKNITMLFVAHKPISHYFSYLEKDKRNEFAKIEKRFSVTSVQSDHATFINIASQFIQDLKLEEIPAQLFRNYSLNVTKFNLFSHHFNATEVDEIIIKSCYPIHPVTIFLLPMISRVFGQNERTLFSFLSDTTLYGFLGYTSKKGSVIYYPDMLADYFFLSIDENFTLKEISILRNNFGLIQQQISNHLIFESERIFKFIALWGLTNANNYFPLNDDFIAFSLGLKKEIVESILDELAAIKLIRFNRDKRYWHVIESESIDIESEIKAKKQFLIANPQLVNQTLNRNNPHKYIYAHEHNNAHEITRFALMNIVLNGFLPNDISEIKYDFLVYVVVNPKESHVQNCDIYCEMQYNEERLVDLVNRLTVVDMLLHDRSFLHLYKNAVVDLEYEKSRLIVELNDFYRLIFRQNYYFYGKHKKITSVHQLEKKLSELANEIYHHSIIIRNDQINMFVLTTQQLNASLEVIKKILDKESFDIDTSFEGSKPDFLIYYSLKQAEGQESYILLKKRIIDYLNQHPSGKFTDLTRIATHSPFGVRPTLSPLIVLSVIVDRFSNMMLSRDGNYIASIDAKQIYDAAQGKYDFDYTYSNFDFEHRDWMRFILNNFPAPSEGVLKKSQSIQVLSSLFNWFNHLPVVVQQGQHIGLQERYFLRNIERSKTNPLEALNKLVDYSENDVLRLKNNISSAHCVYLDKLEDNLLRDFGITDWQTWANSCDLIKHKSNKLVRIALKSKQIVREYSKEIDTIEIERWTTGSYEKLIASIKSDFLDASNKHKTLLIELNGVKREINDIEIGSKAINLKRNLVSLIDANKRYITQSEVEKVIIELLEKYVK